MSILEQIEKAIVQIRKHNGRPTKITMHPDDWLDATTEIPMGIPADVATEATLYGLEVRRTDDCPRGKWYVT